MDQDIAADLQTPIGIIGFGQLGGSLGKSLRAQGVCAVLAYEPLADSAKARAEAAGVRLLESPAGLSAADIVFSMVNATGALAAARSCAPSLAQDAIYVDLNSMGPSEKRAVAEVVHAAGRRFVDGAVLGAAADGIRMPIILSGPDAEHVVARLQPLGMDVRAVSAEIGHAASIKIVRSVLAKGMEVLYVEALLAARQLGVEEEVLKTFCDWLDARPAAASAAILVTTHPLHAERRMHELDMSIAVVRQTGIDPVLTRAVRARLATTAATGVAAALQGMPPASIEQALALLDAALRPQG